MSPSFGEGVLDALKDDPLSPPARSHHRNVLLVGSIAILVAWLDLVPQEISAIGVRFETGDQRSILIALLVVLVYFHTAFLVYAMPDFVAWLRVRASGRSLAEGSAADRGRLEAGYLEILRQHEGDNEEQRKQTVREVARALRDVNEAALRERTVRVLLPLAAARALVDFAIPLIVGVTGIVWLVIEIR